MIQPMVVLIATAGRSTSLDQTLGSLAKCKKPECFAGTIVVENGQKFSAESIVGKYADALQARYYYFPQGNKSAALNHALQYIPDSTLIVFTDDDIKLGTDILVAYEQASRAESKDCYFGGAMFATYEEKPPSWLLHALPASARGWQPNGDKDYKVTPRFLGCNWAAYAETLKELGGFNEKLGPGTKPKRTGQEWDMQERLLANGSNAVYVQDAQVWHYVPKSRSNLRWLIKRRFQGGLGSGISYVERKGKNTIPLGLLVNFVRSLIWFPLSLFTFSRSKMVLALSSFSTRLGSLKGYWMAQFSDLYK